MTAYYKVSMRPKEEGQKGYYGFITFKTEKADVQALMKSDEFVSIFGEEENITNIELVFEGSNDELEDEIQFLLEQISGVGETAGRLMYEVGSTGIVGPVCAVADTLENQVKRLKDLIMCLKWQKQELKEGKPYKCEECLGGSSGVFLFLKFLTAAPLKRYNMALCYW